MKESSTIPHLHLSRVHFPVTTLGPGNRIAVWFQGCSLRCPGCVSRDTWEHGTGEVSLDRVTDLLRNWLSKADGLTVSGGEPFEQPAALMALLQWWKAHSVGDALLYSGLPWEQLQTEHPPILALSDAIISDPYDCDAPQTLPLRGSDNQRLHLLTPLARQRYASLTSSSALELCVDGDQVWLAGIPRRGDLPRLRQRLAELGISSATSEQASMTVLA